jgi:hypothetical protein
VPSLRGFRQSVIRRSDAENIGSKGDKARAGLAFKVIKQMTSFMYRCPNTGLQVQGFVVVEELPEHYNFEAEDGPYESMYCEKCRQAHFVNPKTGKVLGDDEDDQ